MTKEKVLVPKKLTRVVRGPTPARVIVSVPHDTFINYVFRHWGFKENQDGIATRDVRSWRVASGFFTRPQLSDLSVDFIRSMASRAYVDVNRPEETAYTDERLAGVYACYHARLQERIECSIEAFGNDRVLLIDLHGYSEQPKIGKFDLILGTLNRKTIPHGDVDRNFAIFMQEFGYKVFVPSSQRQADERYRGGYSVRHYSREYGINAIQVEVHQSLREKNDRRTPQALGMMMSRALAMALEV